MADDRTIAEIEWDLAQARRRLSENLAQLVVQVHPKAVKYRAIESARRKMRAQIQRAEHAVRKTADKVARQFKDEDGWNLRSVAVAGAAVVAVVVLVVVNKKK